jgi:hypothetical protein
MGLRPTAGDESCFHSFSPAFPTEVSFRLERSEVEGSAVHPSVLPNSG